MSFDFRALAEGRLHEPVAVAEIGTAHGGDLQRGLDLIDAAADAGAHVAKVQVVFAEEILPPEAGLVPLPGGPTPLYEVFRALERPAGFYAALAERAEKRGIGFLASPFGEKSVRLLEDIGVEAWKVASPELNHEPLLERLAATGLPLILSTGVSLPEDIDRALEVITGACRPAESVGRPSPGGPGHTSQASGNPPSGFAPSAEPPVVLLHCLTSYPAPEDQANLRAVPALAAAYGVPAGLSDHSRDPVLLPSLAVALGAVLVEKHITLDRSAGGLDDPVALTPGDFARMTVAMERFAGRALPAAVDDLAGGFGRERVESCLGGGAKTLAPAEAANYGRTNRSLHAVGALAAGTVLTEENTALLRTEKVLRPGIPPHSRREAYGKRLVRPVAPGDGITWEDIGAAKEGGAG